MQLRLVFAAILSTKIQNHCCMARHRNGCDRYLRIHPIHRVLRALPPPMHYLIIKDVSESGQCYKRALKAQNCLSMRVRLSIQATGCVKKIIIPHFTTFCDALHTYCSIRPGSAQLGANVGIHGNHQEQARELAKAHVSDQFAYFCCAPRTHRPHCVQVGMCACCPCPSVGLAPVVPHSKPAEAPESRLCL